MQNENKDTSMERELTVGMLLDVLKKNVIWIALIAVVVGTFAGIYTTLFVKTEYQGTSSYWVNNISENADYIQSTMVSASSQLAENYTEIVKQKITLQKAIEQEEIDLRQKFPDKTDKEIIEYLSRVITTKHNEGSVIFTVVVTDSDRERAYLITAAIQVALPEVIRDHINKKLDKEDGSGDNVASMPSKDPIITTNFVNSKDDIVAVEPPIARNAALAAVAAFVIVYAIFLIFTLLDTLVYDEKSLKDNFDLPVLGTIPTWNTNHSKKLKRSVVQRLMAKPNVATHKGKIVRDYEERLITSHAPFAISEAFKLLRTNVSYSKVGVGTPVYVVTSTLAGAGKSIVSSNLALSFAELGKKTLIVESDMRCPTFSQIYSFDADRKGLSELLAGIQQDVEPLLITDFSENLHILPAGHLPPNPSELLAQGRMKALLDAWREQYDIVIIDAPPYGEVSDAGVLASVVDGYILVARSEYSDVSAVRRTVTSLKALSAPILGFILNDVDPKSARGAYAKNYGYGYGYGYGSYYQPDSDGTKKADQ